MKLRSTILLLLLSQLLLAQGGGTYLEIETNRQVIPLDQNAFIFIDSTAKLSFEEVSQPAFQANFHALDSTVFEEQPEKAFWLKIPLSTQDTMKDWYFVLKDSKHYESELTAEYVAGNEVVDVWVTSGFKEVQHFRTGMLVPASEKIYTENNRVNAVPISMQPGDSSAVFIRVQNSFETPARLSAELRAPYLPLPIDITESSNQFFLAIGIAGTLSLLSFFFFFFVRDKAYLFFGLFALALTLHYTILHPACLFISWFVPEHPILVQYAWVVLTRGTYICFAFFGRSFVGLRERYPRIDKILLLFVGLMFLSMLITSISIFREQPNSYIPLFLIALFGILALGIRLLFVSDILARIFGAGTAWLFLFSILGILWNLEIITFPVNPWMVSQLGLMIIYTFGLAYKLHLNEKARANAQRVIELDAMKSRFFANISHEFRTPLTLIQGPIKKAAEQLPVSEYEGSSEVMDAEINIPVRHVRMMRRNAERLGQLINQLLDLSKLENGSMQLRVADGDIIAFMRAMVFSFESLAERRQIHLQTEFPEAGQTTYFDKDKLEKIISNLLSNALKYTPERGRVAVEVILENGRLKFSVEDSGPGIAREDLDKIFDRFYQVEGTEDKGTGIGLSLVKELVDLYGGQINVESVKNKGTVFRVSIPVEKTAFDIKVINEQKPHDLEITNVIDHSLVAAHTLQISETLPGDQNQSSTVLIVEDNPDLRQFIGETLQPEYQVLYAENGKKGLLSALDHTPDLIVSDVMMPEMDGFELCEKLKSDERTSHIPVILLTAKAGQQHKVAGLETGADAYLTKPFDEAELLVRVKKLIEQRETLRERFSGTGSIFNLLDHSPDQVAVVSADERFLQKVMTSINENISNEFFSVEDLATAVAFSRSQLHRKLKAIIGKSATDLIREIRLARAKMLLEQGYGNVSEVAMEVGYNSLSYFTKSYKAAFGKRPSEV